MEAVLVDGPRPAPRGVLDRYALETITDRYLEVLEPGSIGAVDRRIAA